MSARWIRRLASSGPLLPCAMALFLLTACNGDSAAAPDATIPDDAEVVARIDGEPITAVDLDAQLQTMASRGEPSEREAALEELIDLHLLRRRAEAEEIHRQPETAAEIRRQRAMLLANHLIRAEIEALNIDDDHLRAAYEEYVDDAAERREYNARHILVESRSEAEDLIRQIEEGGDFGELAREYSTGPSGDRGGDLDWFRADEVVEPFARVVAGLSPDEYTGEPVETRFGWHVILLQDVREIDPEPFEAMRDQLREREVNAHVQQFLRELRENSEIEIE